MRLVLLLCGALATAVLAGPGGAAEFRSGLEEGGPPGAWTLGDGGLSAVSDARALTGHRSLPIADPDNKSGSAARSQRLPVAAGQLCLVSVWTFLETGDPGGLGVYLDFTGADGKRLAEASEASCHRPVMRLGQWSQLVFTVAGPAEAREAGLWLHSFSNAIVKCYVDDVELRLVSAEALGPAADWQGGVLDDQTRQVWPYAVRWEHGSSPSLTRTFPQPQDWSDRGAVRFWVHSGAANGSTFMVILNSENPASEGPDYFAVRLTLDWQG